MHDARVRSWRALAVLLVVVAGCSGGSSKDTSASSSSGSASVEEQGAENVAFYYQTIKAGTDLTKLGTVKLIVTTPQDDDQAAINAIHATGAKAFRYVQFYWAPDNESYEGFDFKTSKDLAFCGTGSTPLVGRTTGKSKEISWYFIDLNEKASREIVAKSLAAIKTAGWDGVMFDRGWSATQTGKDAAGKPVWPVASTCTSDPVTKGATFADAYVSMVSEGKKAGLQVLLNAGTSPYDPVTPMRPDPKDAACQAEQWDSCHFLDDVYDDVDLFLDEAPGHPDFTFWDRDFEANKRNEQRGKVIGLLTSGTLGGRQTKDAVYQQWAQIRLFAFPLGVNTGDDKCPGAAAGAICNRFGSFPELATTQLGRPSGDQPTSTDCASTTEGTCLWQRTYASGLVVLNRSGADQVVHIEPGGSGCWTITDVYSASIIGNKGPCSDQADITVPAGAGRVVTYRAG